MRRSLRGTDPRPRPPRAALRGRRAAGAGKHGHLDTARSALRRPRSGGVSVQENGSVQDSSATVDPLSVPCSDRRVLRPVSQQIGIVCRYQTHRRRPALRRGSIELLSERERGLAADPHRHGVLRHAVPAAPQRRLGQPVRPASFRVRRVAPRPFRERAARPAPALRRACRCLSAQTSRRGRGARSVNCSGGRNARRAAAAARRSPPSRAGAACRACTTSAGCCASAPALARRLARPTPPSAPALQVRRPRGTGCAPARVRARARAAARLSARGYRGGSASGAPPIPRSVRSTATVVVPHPFPAGRGPHLQDGP